MLGGIKGLLVTALEFNRGGRRTSKQRAQFITYDVMAVVLASSSR